MECFTFSFWPRYLGLIFIRHSIGNRILNLLGRNMIGNQSLRLPLTSIPSSCHLARLYTYLPSLGLCLLDTRHPLPEVLLMLKCCPNGLNLQWYSELPCTLTWPSSVFGCIATYPCSDPWSLEIWTLKSCRSSLNRENTIILGNRREYAIFNF